MIVNKTVIKREMSIASERKEDFPEWQLSVLSKGY